MSPNKMADLLNREGIPGPRGPAWDKSTIHGNPKRGTGILNNELYIGRWVWNRQEFVKDPRTGKRQARPNSETEFEYADVPDLRIIPQDLWDAVKARQQSRKIKHTKANAWERRKPRFLFSGLIKCGCCGGGFSTVARDRFGCSNSRNKGISVCTNRTTIARRDMEERILTSLTDHLMDPDLVKAFAQEYIAERNRLAATRTDDRAVTANRPAMLAEVATFFADPAEPLPMHETVDADHGRIEARRHWVTPSTDWLFGDRAEPGAPVTPGLATLACVEASRDGAPPVRRYYLSSTVLTPEQFARAVSAHWAIENSLHWVLDVTFDEDRARARRDNSPENLAILRRLALNILQKSRKDMSIARKRKSAGWSDDFARNVIGQMR